MAFNLDFNAPMFVDFENDDHHDDADAFFDLHGEDAPSNSLMQVNSTEDLPPTLPPKPRVTRSTGQALKPVNRQATTNTSVDHLRPKSNCSSSLKTINKSATKPAQRFITKEKAAAIVDRLCPSSANHGIKNKFISLAEESKKFFATPERFRSRSTVKARSSSVDALFKRKRSPSPAVKRAIFATEPQSPRLLTRERSRSKVVQPSEQQPPPELKLKSAETRLASLKKRVALTTQQPIKQTLTSRARMEKEKAPAGPSGPLKARLPGIALQHKGVPVIHSKFHSKKVEPLKATSIESESNKKPFNNEVFEKLYNQFKVQEAKLASEREKEIEREKQLALFKASEPKVLNKRPFMPKQCDKSPVKPLESTLHTEMRAEERRQFEEWMRQKEAEMQSLKAQEMEKREREERLESLRSRIATVHKANPIRHYQAIEIRPSDKPVTQPMTPRFTNRRRRQLSE